MQYRNSSYDIYEDGRCYSHLSHKFLTPQLSNKYPTYNLTIEGKKKKTYIHRMVAETFLIQPEGKTIVNHKDGNTHNYHVTNLEWVTPAENSKHASDLGLITKGDQSINKYINNLPEEKWAAILDFPQYVASSCGRIMNIRTKRLLKQTIDARGYKQVSLWKEGKGYTKEVHPLIYYAFSSDRPEQGYVINHLDGNKTNNNLNNLNRVTYRENNLHAVYVIKTHTCATPVAQLDQDKNIIQIFSSIAEATRQTKINNISRAIKTQRMAGSYFWIKYNKQKFNDYPVQEQDLSKSEVESILSFSKE